ncbi:GPI-inositol-deacylase [Trametes sanguinea]|nr:GPI-inositol-deacylase [Trametes sanguinea]
MSRLLAVFASFAVAAVVVFYYAGSDTLNALSPQGCRMSWMWPTYLLQTGFDHSWTPLARRYSLWLYREGNLESNLLHGSPVLFIPGNAGSSHQVRSIASSAANQYFSAPYQVSPEFENKGYTGLDFFAVEFNEDLSAFHGPTLDSETAYASRAIDYILSLYPQNTSIMVMGHSMGGVVATALLPHPNVSAIITMSTPHTLPPVRFDRRIDHIYASNLKTLASDPTAILSLCGGATDLMIPSESCILPSLGGEASTVYRRTVFTSALEGCWTGVGHLAMVWCHQVRWRIARAALEIAAAPSLEARAVVLDRWLRDGHTLPPAHSPSDVLQLRPGDFDLIPQRQSLLVRNPVGTHTYVLSPPAIGDGQSGVKFILYASQGSVPPVAPHRPFPFRTTVYVCPESHSDLTACSTLPPSTLKLIPNPVPGAPFPVPDEGTDESEGVVLYEADLVTAGSRVAVKIEDGDGRGWVFGQFVPSEPVVTKVGLTSLLLASVRIAVPSDVRIELHLPALPANALLVYRLTPGYHPDSVCSADSLLLPVLTHRSHPSETHYYPLTPSFSRRILLHSHASGPYIASDHPVGHTLTIHSSGECRVSEIELSVDWWASIGRWGSRYATAAACWAVGIVAILLWDLWRLVEGGALVPDVRSSLELFVRRRMPWLVALAYAVSLLPLRAGVWLGNRGDPVFAPLAALLLPIAFGLVCVSWWLLLALIWPLKSVMRRFGRRREDFTARRPLATLASMGFIFLVIFILVPWQVAFLGCWLIHLYTCATSLADLSHTQGQRSSEPEAVPLVRLMSSTEAEATSDERQTRQAEAAHANLLQQANVHLHVLLFTTWLLPLAAPVLAVWVRTLATAGFTTPFDGDHNFLYVAPFLVLVEALSGADANGYVKALFERRDKVSPRWGFAGIAGVAFLMGPRTTYLVFETASAAMGWMVVRRIGPFYWAGRSASRRG